LESDELRQALELAGRALSARDRTVAELRAHLVRKGVAREAVDAALRKLSDSGYLDDARYARRFADDKRSLHRWGRERIERELRRRGVPPGLIGAALAEALGTTELEAARTLLAERFPQPPAGDRERDRAWRLLVGRGYEPEVAYEAVRAHERAR
jgi:regulatory protein